MFSNQEAMQQLKARWVGWTRGDSWKRGETKWRDLFALLRDIRPWSSEDRLKETGILEDWADRIKWEKDTVLPCEIELWYRDSPAKRSAAAKSVRARVLDLGGEILSEADLEGIRYHALAVRIPVHAVESILNADERDSIALVQAEQVQFFRASGQMAGIIPQEASQQTPVEGRAAGPRADQHPCVALLDGLPLQSHQALSGRLSIDDPDNYSENYESQCRQHGTAMSSLIVWGDLHSASAPIPQQLYVRPIMRPVSYSDESVRERVPESELVVDLVHRAVKRIFEGEGSDSPVAPSVSVINLSIGIADRPFNGTMSPLARLLDWLAWTYQVLFVVSAGNHYSWLSLGCSWSDLKNANPEDLVDHVTQRVAIETRHRRLLSPAEAVNVLTVGSLHDDDDTQEVSPKMLDGARRGFPSPFSAHGYGYKRSVKPDVLAPGGRMAFARPFNDDSSQLRPLNVHYGPGQLVAVPGPLGGDTMAVLQTRGTSNATALVSRAAAFLAPLLSDLERREGGKVIAEVPKALWTKALLVHGASWGEAGAAYGHLTKHLAPSANSSEWLARFLGFGAMAPDSLPQCSQHRVTALSGGELVPDDGAVHSFPLPPTLSGKRCWRRVTVTLTWFTPVHPTSHKWRCAQLWFKTPSSKMNFGSKGHLSRRGPDWQAVQRGTVQHEVFEGEKAAAFVDGDEIEILVSCRDDAPGLREAIPYALVVTLEAAEEIGVNVDLYAEVKARVQAKVRIR